MGAHGTVEDALANIAAFNQAAALQARRDKKAEDQKRKRDKGRAKERDGDKGSKHKRKRRKHSSDSSGDEEGPLSATQQLQHSQAAVRALREVLSSHPAVKKELREVGALAPPQRLSAHCRGAQLLAPRSCCGSWTRARPWTSVACRTAACAPACRVSSDTCCSSRAPRRGPPQLCAASCAALSRPMSMPVISTAVHQPLPQ